MYESIQVPSYVTLGFRGCMSRYLVLPCVETCAGHCLSARSANDILMFEPTPVEASLPTHLVVQIRSLKFVVNIFNVVT
jgi:hypothetical protein